jgi:hypothetical protein
MADKNTVLDHYLNLANNVSDFASAADLIIKVIESPSVYSFSEILEAPFINSVNINSIYFFLIYANLQNRN